jgi:pilus assembly protein CpaE
VLLVASMDIPSIKNLKVGMQTLDLLELASGKLRLVLNRSNSKVMLDIKEIERTLGVPIEFPVASDIAVPQAVNRGVPVVVDNPKSPAAKGLEAIVDAFIGDEPPKIASAEEVQQAEKEGKPRRWWRTRPRKGNA